MRIPNSLTWLTALVAGMVLVFLTLNAYTLKSNYQNAPFSLHLHTDLTTGLTSCNMEAGNVFDFAHFAVVPPAFVQQVRFYAQGFQGGSGAVTARLYAVDDARALGAARLLATALPVSVAGDSMTAYLAEFGSVAVDSRYVLASLEFSGATVIGASQGSQSGGSSFATGCDLTGPANMNDVIVESNWALGIEILGYTVAPATATLVLTDEPTAEATPLVTVEVTPDLTMEPTAESTVQPTEAATEEPTAENTALPVQDTPTNAVTQEATIEPVMPTPTATTETVIPEPTLEGTVTP